MTRSFLRRVCRVLIGVVLLAQAAVSAYACPGLAAGAAMKLPVAGASSAPSHGDAQPAAMAPSLPCHHDAGPGPMNMDPDFPTLCAEHCHPSQQSDQAATVSVPPAWLTLLYSAPLLPPPAVAPRPAADSPSALAAASPPRAILHCCFRI